MLMKMMKTQIHEILEKNYKKNRKFGFSKFMLFTKNEKEDFTKLKLKQDDIRICQHSFYKHQSHRHRDRNAKVAKSMQVNENVTVAKLHQI